MGDVRIVERTETEVELVAVVNRSSGPVTGATVVVAVRDGETANSWLDFADGVFKTAGWTTRQAAVAEVSAANAPGIYRRVLNLTAITLPAATDHLVAEYAVTSPAGFPTDIDYILLVNHTKDVAIPGDAMDLVTDAVDAGAVAASGVAEIQAGLATAAAVAAVQADTDDMQARLPAALVGGRIDASVGAMAAGTVTAAAIATDAIDADAIAASAVTEIQAGLATLTNQATILAALAVINADTDDLQARLPSSLVGGRMRSHVEAIDAGLITPTVAPNLDVAVSTRAAPGAAMTLTTAERDAVANALLDLANGVETPHTVRQILRIIAAAVAGKTSGGPATQVFRNLADTADRLTTVSNASGDRTAATATP